MHPALPSRSRPRRFLGPLARRSEHVHVVAPEDRLPLAERTGRRSPFFPHRFSSSARSTIPQRSLPHTGSLRWLCPCVPTCWTSYQRSSAGAPTISCANVSVAATNSSSSKMPPIFSLTMVPLRQCCAAAGRRHEAQDHRGFVYARPVISTREGMRDLGGLAGEHYLAATTRPSSSMPLTARLGATSGAGSWSGQILSLARKVLAVTRLFIVSSATGYGGADRSIEIIGRQPPDESERLSMRPIRSTSPPRGRGRGSPQPTHQDSFCSTQTACPAKWRPDPCLPSSDSTHPMAFSSICLDPSRPLCARRIGRIRALDGVRPCAVYLPGDLWREILRQRLSSLVAKGRRLLH